MAIDVLIVEGESPATPGFLRWDRARWHVGDTFPAPSDEIPEPAHKIGLIKQSKIHLLYPYPPPPPPNGAEW